MVYIWNAYEKEAEKRHKGISKMEGFKYPAILPIVYYEGKDRWSAPLNFKSRINQGELYGNYVPDFQLEEMVAIYKLEQYWKKV